MIVPYTKLEYVWIGGREELRSKTKIVPTNYEHCAYDLDKLLKIMPDWNYDGSSTKQASGDNSEIVIKPIRVYKNPFSKTGGFIVLCDTYLPDDTPHPTNTRHKAKEIFDKYNAAEEKPLFGLEHEFFVIDLATEKPLGFPSENELPPPQGPYYCSVGAGKCYGKEFLEECLDACIFAGVNVTGSNLEVCPGQMEIQVCDYDLKAGDDSLMLKYILHRTGEKYGYQIDHSAKPVKGDWNGSGCHANFSTQTIREPNSYDIIINMIRKLNDKHDEHIAVYGVDNKERLTGLHETSSIDIFSYGVADRGASVRIPWATFNNKCGYFEDRRPSSSSDSYLVISTIFKTCVE